MALVGRLIDIVALPARTVDGIWSRLVPVLRRFPASLVIAALLVVMVAQEVQRKDAAVAAMPLPERTSISALADARGQFWVTLPALISGPHADSGIYREDRSVYYRVIDEPHDAEGRGFSEQAPPGLLRLPQGDGLLRYLYVLRDPLDPTMAMVALSSSDGDLVRARTVATRVVSAAGEELRLVELDDPPAELAAAGLPTRHPGDVQEHDDVVLLTGRFAEGRPTSCRSAIADACSDGVAYEYHVLDDSGGDVIVVSRHPPDALRCRSRA